MPYPICVSLSAAKTYMTLLYDRNLGEAIRGERANPLGRTPGHGVNERCRDGGYGVMSAGAVRRSGPGRGGQQLCGGHMADRVTDVARVDPTRTLRR